MLDRIQEKFNFPMELYGSIYRTMNDKQTTKENEIHDFINDLPCKLKMEAS